MRTIRVKRDICGLLWGAAIFSLFGSFALFSLNVAPAQTPEYALLPVQRLVARDGTPNVLKKLWLGNEVAVAYFGGSITAADGWRPKSLEWLKKEFPKASIREINAAIGGTGSDLGAYRCEWDVLRHQPDLVFVEFAVNDSGQSPESIWRSMEGIVRQIWRQNIETDIVFVYTFRTGFEKEIERGFYPPSASAMEMLAARYGIGSVNFSVPIVERAQAGSLVYVSKEPVEGKIVFSTDGVHPGPEGHAIYTDEIASFFQTLEHQTKAQSLSVTAAIEQVNARRILSLQTPFIAENIENAKMVDFSESMFVGDWAKLPPDDYRYESFHARMGDAIWSSNTPGSSVSFQFKGKSCKIYDLVGPDGGQAIVTVDGVTQEQPIPRFDGFCTYWRLATLPIADNLDPETVHTVTITIHPDEPDRSLITHLLADPEKELASDRYHGHRLWLAKIMLVGDLYSESAVSSPVYQITADMPAWSRDKDALSVSAEADHVGKVVHTGEHDWAVRLPESIAVTPGEIWTLSCRMKFNGKGNAQTGATLYADKEPTHWIFGGASTGACDEWRTLQSEFVVPNGTTSITPRLTGSGEGELLFADYTIQKTGKLELLQSDEVFSLENDTLSLTVKAKDAVFAVTDKRTARTWNSVSAAKGLYVLDAKKEENAVRIELLDGNSMQKFTGVFRLEPDAPEMTVTLEPNPDNPRMGGEILWPGALETAPNDRIILPINEGFSFPAKGPNPTSSRLYTYGGHGLCMPFWGVVDETNGAGYLGIIETADDAGVATVPFQSKQADGKNQDGANQDGANQDEQSAQELFAPGPYWVGQKSAFGYARKVRCCFSDQGGYVALCKRYRTDAQKRGLYVPFSEKIRRNPSLEDGLTRLRGAANIWCWEKAKSEIISMLRSEGIDRILWSAGGSAEEIAAMNADEKILTCRYDIYQDIMDPARYPELGGIHGGWIPEAWPNEIVIQENGDWQKGWSVTPKDATKPRIPCGVICDSKALPYAEKRIAEELAAIPYKARFLDTTVAAPWQQCFSPEHPMTRSESRVWKMKLLALLGERFHLVCGSETGHEASVPYCDFFEGMMSLGSFRVPESGRDMIRIWDDVPERVEKYQVGEAFRLPLWELVYHDCTVSYWYWGDYNNKLPKIWKKRDLFNALYGVPPMYMFTADWFRQNRERFAESWKIASDVAYRTGWSEMTDHQILTEDRTVQKSVFSDGTEVIVNFGEKPFVLENGETLDGLSVWKNF